ncbi:hypothetical protein CTI12_AA331220 [Artemisia annua]|uniref:Homologous recombination OB-fold protein OB-fold domain-containing protein n=1 Tax=Artemisia annua TaxID=35608 RepID=A0A2U1MWE7_ARTAN|nr:hypothetical protein CTI12_AA331220 [Artemisia annua]
MKKGKLEQVVAILNPEAPNALGDLTVTLKDPMGSVTGSVHHKVFNEGTGYRRNHFTKEAALILANVSVFSPKQSSHYLNITIRNIVKVFNRDTGPENVSGLNQGEVLYSGAELYSGPEPNSSSISLYRWRFDKTLSHSPSSDVKFTDLPLLSFDMVNGVTDCDRLLFEF